MIWWYLTQNLSTRSVTLFEAAQFDFQPTWGQVIRFFKGKNLVWVELISKQIKLFKIHSNNFFFCRMKDQSFYSNATKNGKVDRKKNNYTKELILRFGHESKICKGVSHYKNIGRVDC